MMIQRFALVALVAALGTSAGAVEFNKDALKALQEEGHRLLEEDGTPFLGHNDLCLDTADDGLVVRECTDADSQRWRLDEEGHLVASSGQCVIGDVLGECGPGDAQRWTYDEQQHLVNGDARCLQIKGRFEADSPVVTAPCRDVARQIWRLPEAG